MSQAEGQTGDEDDVDCGVGDDDDGSEHKEQIQRLKEHVVDIFFRAFPESPPHPYPSPSPQSGQLV